MRRRSGRGKALPSVARERLEVVLVGELGVGDSELALKVVMAAKRFESAVNLGVEP